MTITAIKQRTLGRTGLQVSELALGGLFTSSFGGGLESSRGAVLRALELGVNYIDTAPGYGNSEETLGQILRGVRQPLILSTKLGGRPSPFKPQDKDCLKRSVDESLRLLGRDHIDLLMIHEPDRVKQYDWWTDRMNFTGPVLDFLEELKAQRVISFTGLGGTTAYELPRIIETGRFDVVLTAFNYSLLWREAEHEILPLARKHNMGIVIGSPLQQGALARRYENEVESGARWLSPPRRAQFKALYRFCDEAGIGVHELAMRFVISNPHISCVLTGSRSSAEVEANAAAVNKGPLSPEILARLNQIAAMVPFRPFNEPFGLPFHSNDPLQIGVA